MLPRDKFNAYVPGSDVYNRHPAALKLDDLPPKYEGVIKLSYMISTYNRQCQLARALETIARQEFREFEVLLMDDGSTQHIQDIVDQFSPFLNITLFRQEKEHWYSCPSRAYKAMMPHAKGDVIAIGHPEMMLNPLAIQYLYFGAHNEIPDDYVHKYVVSSPEPKTTGDYYWVSLKALYLIEEQYELIDGIDWHSDVDNLRNIPSFWSTKGFAGMTNIWHDTQQEYPWWFVGSTTKDNPMWNDMPVFDGHGIIDMWMVTYRSKHGIVDVVPIESMADQTQE